MRQLSEKRFQSFLKDKKLRFDSDHGYIHFTDKSNDFRFWYEPESIPRLIYMLECILNFLSPWNSIILFKQGGSWISSSKVGIIDTVKHQFYTSLNLPKKDTALIFSRKEITKIISLLTLQQMFGWCIWDDIYAIPDHAKQMVRTSHHKMIKVEFKTSKYIKGFVNNMEKEDFFLPDEVKDKTIKKPSWIK